ncbi:hypothetical protein [Streptomyces sp. V1I6]|uniref:hypothetical protein n=1 Tax=Streptomyces sp. V1I6 TaxID=3042273 RepID=UPI0027D878DA|nr:hypothetical protein [Streptomyces sp. V1I6]
MATASPETRSEALVESEPKVEPETTVDVVPSGRRIEEAAVEPQAQPAPTVASGPSQEPRLKPQDKPEIDSAGPARTDDAAIEPQTQPAPTVASGPSQEPRLEADNGAEKARARRARRSWAHKAIHESFADAKLRSARWKSHGFRISPEVLTRLKDRLNADRRSTGNSSLALGHYVDAALRNLPATVEEQIEMAAAFEANQLWDQERTQPSNYRVGESAYDLMANLKLALQEADFGRRGTHVVSAGIERLLDALDAEGPLQRPERRRA